MSFFEKMMKINQQKPQPMRQSIYLQEQTAPNQDRIPGQKPRKVMKDYSLRSSLSLKIENSESQQEFQEIPQQPSIEQIYKQPKPTLMLHLLPRKQQMMRQMLARKKDFELRQINLCIEKKGVLLEKIQEERYGECEGKTIEKSRVQKLRTSSVRNLSDNKPKPALNLGESIYSASLNTQFVGSPVADNFNKEIMLKLLDIIEKDRSNTNNSQIIPQNKECSSKKQRKQAPIIINNIMKTPMDTINRDLMQKQMKIKILENERMNRQFIRGSAEGIKSKPSLAVSETLFTNDINEEVIYTERQASRPSIGGISVTANTCPVQNTQSRNIQVMQTARQQRYLKQQNNENKMEINTFRQGQLSQKIEGYEKSTNVNSCQNSRINEEDIRGKGRQRDFKKNQTKDMKNNAFQKIENSTKPIEEKTEQKVKASVKIEIPFENQSKTQGMTLAQAFKKRAGRLKSEQHRSEKALQKSPNPNTNSKLQSFPSQMAVTISDKFTQYNSEFDYSAPLVNKVININLEEPQTHRSVVSGTNKKQSSIRKSMKEEKMSTKKLADPSKELIDRLIYGERAKVSKQQMYALTRKNYANLPEVQAKKKEQQKRKVEQQRISKAKQYQKAIRSGKSQLRG